VLRDASLVFDPENCRDGILIVEDNVGEDGILSGQLFHEEFQFATIAPSNGNVPASQNASTGAAID
jgi:hypothetical protein